MISRLAPCGHGSHHDSPFTIQINELTQKTPEDHLGLYCTSSAVPFQGVRRRQQKTTLQFWKA